MSKGLIINEDVWVLIENLFPEEQAELLKCLAAYHRGLEVPEMSRMVMGVYQRITLDNARFDPAKKAELSAMRSEVGKKGAEARWQTMANMANDSKNGKLPQDKKRKEENRIDKNRRTEPHNFNVVSLSDEERAELGRLSDSLSVEIYIKKIVAWQQDNRKMCSKPFITIKNWIEEDQPKKKPDRGSQSKDTSYDLNEWERMAMNFDPEEGKESNE